MKEQHDALVIVFALVASAVSGMSGACAIVASKYLHGKNTDMLAFVAYALIGIFTSLVMFGFYILQGWVNPTILEAVVYGGSSGAIMTLIVVCVNWGSRVILKFKGIQAEITFSRPEEKQ
jgi:hypothetical protein